MNCQNCGDEHGTVAVDGETVLCQKCDYASFDKNESTEFISVSQPKRSRSPPARFDEQNVNPSPKQQIKDSNSKPNICFGCNNQAKQCIHCVRCDNKIFCQMFKPDIK